MKRILSAQSAVLFLTGSCAVLTVACSSLQRSNASGYSAIAQQASSHEDRRNLQLDTAAEQLDFEDPSSLTGSERQQVHICAKLDRAETFLEGKREREQYFKNKPYMKNDYERIAFLRVADFETRERWLDAHGINGASTVHNPDVQNLVDRNDIAVGMTEQAVRDSWGPPESVGVAGNSLYGNERWSYSEQIASTDGYRNEKRAIYFESGRVVGWERK